MNFKTVARALPATLTDVLVEAGENLGYRRGSGIHMRSGDTMMCYKPNNTRGPTRGGQCENVQLPQPIREFPSGALASSHIGHQDVCFHIGKSHFDACEAVQFFTQGLSASVIIF